MKNYVQVFSLLLILTLLLSLIFSILYYFHIISTTVFHIGNTIGGLIAYSISGVFLGLKTNKKALFHALPVILICFSVSFLISNFSWYGLLENIAKNVFFVVFCLITYAKSNH